MKAEKFERILEAVRHGHSFDVACCLVGVGRETLRVHRKKYPEDNQRLLAAKEGRE